MLTFAEKFCLQNKIEPGRYRAEVLRRTLYPRAAHIINLLNLIPGYFEADHELIDAVGRFRDMKGFANEEADFNQHRRNRGFLRRTLHLRVSVGRLKSLVKATLGPEG
jgi:hypothetical protein